jgi:NADH-quinone oxidoreductase subunit D
VFRIAAPGSAFLHRANVRIGSFAAIGMIQKLIKGLRIEDLVVLIASLDVIAPQIDR